MVYKIIVIYFVFWYAVLDVSGSMGLGFSNETAYDSNFKSKLNVAKDCLTSLVGQLKPK